MNCHILFVPLIQAVKWRLHLRFSELVATGAERTLYYYINREGYEL
jgi:hypothetical protein